MNIAGFAISRQARRRNISHLNQADHRVPREFADHARVTLLQLRLAMAGFRKFEDIIAWQLAYRLKVDVDVFLERPDFRRRFKFHDQLHDAVRSGPRNIAEGHLRGFKHKEFAQFVRIARGSEGEVLNHLRDAHDQRLISATELEAASRPAKRAIKAASNLIRYLESTPDPAPPPYRPSDL